MTLTPTRSWLRRSLKAGRVPSSASAKRAAGLSTKGVHASWRQLAQWMGIQTSYIDMEGRRIVPDEEVLKAILKILGISGASLSEARQGWLDQQQAEWHQLLDPVAVGWDGVAKIKLRIPLKLQEERLQCVLHLENGSRAQIHTSLDRLRMLKLADVTGQKFALKELVLPRLPLGYHTLEVETRGHCSRSLIISAPGRSYSPAHEQKAWGAFLPMYAAHSEQSWGAGNIGDWRQLSNWVASLGGSVIGSLPLLAAFLDVPHCEPSPYSPASRLFWNEFYLDIPAIPQFSRCQAAQQLFHSAAFQNQLGGFRRDSWIDYRAQMRARRQVLERLADFFFAREAAGHRPFQRFLKERPAVIDYAEFRAATERTKAPWHQWSERMRQGKLRPGDFAVSARNYHLYVQWLAQEQMNALVGHCRRQGLHFYLDLPLGVHPDGYDLWRQRDAFAFPASAGAPPDQFFTKGQNWGFAPLHPQRLRESGYRYLLEFLRFQMRHTDLLRIDHVMGLHRLYWIPPGFPADQGAYVNYPAEELYAIFCLESHRHHTRLVGENLGTVPPEVNFAMARHGLRQTYVLQYEQPLNPKSRLRAPPASSVASLNTHDMPTFAEHWQGLDLKERVKLGLIPKRKLPRERALRKQSNLALLKFLRRKGCFKTSNTDVSAALQACLAWLASSRAEMLLVNLEDLWQETQPQNVPGTSREKPNWRHKSKWSIEQISQPQALRHLLKKLLAGRGRS